MASVSSFRDVIANMYYNELFDELSEYIEDNPDKLESNSYHVQSPDEAALSDFDIIMIDITVKSLLFCKKPSGDWYVPTVLAPCDGWFGNAGALCNRPPLLPLDVRPHVEVLPVSRPCLVLLHQ